MKNVTNIKEFEKNGILKLKSPYDEGQIEGIYNWFNRDMPKDWWYKSYMPHEYAERFGLEDTQYLSNIERNEPFSDVMYKHSKYSLHIEDFSYSFFRTKDDHQKTCKCVECILRKGLGSKETLEWIADNTGVEVTKPHELFASWYDEGDFLSKHSDTNNGKVGFVLSLTKEWIPEYGGLLHIMDKEWNEVKEVIIPKFNQIVLFDTVNSNSPHFVSEVVTKGIKRLAYTGWYE
tara:strand:+ start:2925 stop:3623 length:699 start_codon:yes stop_codon:yes gene_type:complete